MDLSEEEADAVSRVLSWEVRRVARQAARRLLEGGADEGRVLEANTGLAEALKLHGLAARAEGVRQVHEGRRLRSEEGRSEGADHA